MKIREDEHGLYIKSADGGAHYRPGYFSGYSHAYDTSDGGLSAGDNPKARRVARTPFIKIMLDDKTLYWGRYDRKEGDF